MKKQLLIAAIAATVSAGSFADISIKGDAQFRYAYQDNDNANGTTTNGTEQSVRLHITGKSGDTTVKLGLRNDGGTRVSGGPRSSGDARGGGSGRGITVSDSDNEELASIASFATDYLFLTTKIGGFNIKAGDWWDTSGLGLVRKGQANPDQVEISTKIGEWKVSLETGAQDSNVVVGAEAKVAGWDLDFEHDTADNKGYTDVAVKGKVGDIGIAAEIYNSDADADANVVHLWTKVGGVTWHIARAYWDADDVLVNDTAGVAPGASGYVVTYADNRANNSKFSPLGVSILGTAPGVNGLTAIGDVNGRARYDANGVLHEHPDTTVTGIRADTKFAGMGVQVAIGNLEIGSLDDSFNDIIVTRPLGKGSNIKFSTGEWYNVRSTGVKVSVKF